MEQGEIRDVLVAQEQARVEALQAELDRRCKSVAGSIDSEDLATLNNVTYQAVRKMLNTNGDQSCFGLKYVPSIAIRAPERFAEEVLFFLCDLCGREHPDKKRDLTPVERLEQLADVLKKMDLDKHDKIKGLI